MLIFSQPQFRDNNLLVNFFIFYPISKSYQLLNCTFTLERRGGHLVSDGGQRIYTSRIEVQLFILQILCEKERPSIVVCLPMNAFALF